MLINLRNALMSGKRLPYDAEVEYLESTGTQYIHTHIFWNRALTISATIAGTQSTSYALQTFFGARDSNAGGAGYSFGFNSSNKFVSDNTGSRAISSMSYVQGDVYTVVKNLSGCSITNAAGTTENIVNSPGVQTPYRSVFLFGLNNVGTFVPTNCRFYACKIYDANGVLVRDFIPVRKGTVGYLYDRVSGKLFGNAGTGDFVLGPDVVPVEYIESHGTEWIDTGLDYFADFEIGIKLRSSVSNKALGTSATMCMERYSASQPYWRLSVNGSTYISAALIVDYHVMSWKGGVFAADGVTVRTVSNPFTSGAMILFGVGKLYFPNMIYNCKLWNSNATLVRSFLPVRVGTEGAMMDVLTRRIYRNQGTGAFSYGNDLRYPIPAA